MTWPKSPASMRMPFSKVAPKLMAEQLQKRRLTQRIQHGRANVHAAQPKVG